MKTLATALLAAQLDAPAIHKDATNPHYKSRFVSLDSLLDKVRPVLNQHGLVLSQWPTHEDGHPALLTRLTHAESGESMESVMLLLAAKNDPQGQGSAITYARRYALMAALGLSADEDDDGERASTNRASEPARASRASTGQSPSPPAGAGAEPFMTTGEAIKASLDQLIKIVGRENAKIAYDLALSEAHVAPGETPTPGQANRIIESLHSASGVPA